MPQDYSRASRTLSRPLPPPATAPKWFVVDLLVVLILAAAVFAGIFAFVNPPRFPESLQRFTGVGIPLIIAASILATTLSMTVTHSRYLAGKNLSLLMLGVLALIIILAIAVTIAFTLHQFLASRAAFNTRLSLHLTVQGLLTIVTLYYSSMLKYNLLDCLYSHTTHAGIARLDFLDGQGASSDYHRDWLSGLRTQREDELAYFERRFDEHLERLESAGSRRGAANGSRPGDDHSGD